jgi:hypothetical protein
LKGQVDGYNRAQRFNILVGRRIQNLKKEDKRKSQNYAEFDKIDESESDQCEENI